LTHLSNGQAANTEIQQIYFSKDPERFERGEVRESGLEVLVSQLPFSLHSEVG
jgi:hypothetical protein